MSTSGLQKIRNIEDSLVWMKRPLHFWDSVNGDINRLLQNVRKLKVTAEKDPARDFGDEIEKYYRASRELRRLVDREVADNIENAEIGRYVVCGIFGFGAAGAVLAYGIPAAVGAGIGSAVFQYGLPAAAALLSAGAVAVDAVRRTPAGRIEDMKDIQPALFKAGEDFRSVTPDRYLGLIRSAMDGDTVVIDRAKSEMIFRIPDEGGDIAIRHIYTALAAEDYNKLISGKIRMQPKFMDGLYMTPYFSSMYRDASGRFGGRDNYCLNFAGNSAVVPCRALSEGAFSYSGIKGELADPVTVEWRDNGFHAERYEDVIRWFGDDLRYISIDKGVRSIAGNLGIVSLVEYHLPRMYRDCFLPESAALLTHVLLNIFLSAAEINSDVKIYYLNLVRRAVGQYVERVEKMRGNFLEAFGTEEGVRPYLEMNRYEKGAVEKVWNYYKDYMPAHVPPEKRSRLEEKLDRQEKVVREIYSLDPEVVRYRFSDPRYVETVKSAFDSYVGMYVEEASGPYDAFRNNLSLTGGFAGWIIHSMITPKTALEGFSAAGRIGATAAWVAAGLVVYPSAATLYSVDDDYDTLPLRLPHLSAVVEAR